MGYVIIEDSTIEGLAKKVNTRIENGWTPLGGVSISLSESDDYEYFVAAQAMMYLTVEL